VTGFAAVRAHPLTGTGLGQFRAMDWVTEEASPHVREHRGKAHNLLLSTAAETGLPGLVLMLVFLGWLVRRMRRQTLVGTAGLAAFAFWAVLGLVHDPMFHPEMSLATVLTFGLAVSRSGEEG
jgi:O-antigen ligase